MMTTETSTDHGGTTAGTVCRIGAAVAVLVSGLVHLQLYLDGYRNIPDIGRSFLLNVVASAVMAVALVWRRELVVRIAAAGLLVGTIVAFVVSRTGDGLFDFRERGLEPSPQAGLALAAEVIGLLLIAATFIPALGAGDTLRPPVVAGAAAATVLIVVVSAALWGREADETVTDAEPSTTSPAATAAATTTAPPTTTPAPTTTTPGATPGPSTTGAAATTTTAAATTTTPAETGVVTVSIQDFAFKESTIEIPVGTTVEWVNEDSFAHSVVAEGGAFESEDLAAGATFRFTFDTAGDFAYFCGIHPSMLGTVVVTA